MPVYWLRELILWLWSMCKRQRLAMQLFLDSGDLATCILPCFGRWFPLFHSRCDTFEAPLENCSRRGEPSELLTERGSAISIAETLQSTDTCSVRYNPPPPPPMDFGKNVTPYSYRPIFCKITGLCNRLAFFLRTC